MPKNAVLCVRVVSDQLCNVNSPPAQVQRDELATRLFRRHGGVPKGCSISLT